MESRWHPRLLELLPSIFALVQLACTSLDRPDDPVNRRPNCFYQPIASPVGDELLVDDFAGTGARAGQTSCLGTGSTCLSTNSATDCVAPQPNVFATTPSLFCDVQNSEPGKLCASYRNDTDPGTHGQYLSLAFDTSGNAQAYSGYIEPLASAASDGLNLRALNYGSVTFWVRARLGSANAELALKSADGRQTAPKVLLNEVLPSGPTSSWTKVRILITALMPIADTHDCVDIDRLTEFNVAFSKDRQDSNGQSVIPNCGVLDIDEIAFER